MKKDIVAIKILINGFVIKGNQTVYKKHRKDKSGKQTYKYYFEKEKCKSCTQREGCMKISGTKILEIGINTPEFYGYSQDQKRIYLKTNTRIGLV